MAAILMICATAFTGCILFDKKIHETLPVAVFAVTLGVYVFALVLPLPVAVYICSGIIILSYLSIILLSLYFRKHSGEPGRGRDYYPRQKTWSALLLDEVSHESSNATHGNERKRLLRGYVSSPSVFVLVIICILFCALMYNRRVFFYDDLSFWGLYTKNIFSIGKLPRLFENCSVDYKDYPPIIQILQYLVMFGKKSFSEPVMFQTNICLIYILLLPLIGRVFDDRNGSGKAGKNSKLSIATRIASVILYIIFPHILTAQFYYRLGVDLFLALVFGYAIYVMYAEEGSEAFRLTAVACSLSFLALIKTSGIVLCILALIMFVMKEVMTCDQKPIYRLGKVMLVSLFTFGSYFSWKMFLRYSGNNGYLSNRVSAGMKSGAFSLPEYTGEVIRNYVNHFFTYPLTSNTIGATAFVLVIFIVVSSAFIRDKDHNSDAMRKGFLVASLIGLVIFCIAHISMYLFVFDEWEAHGLLEYDRYIMQYLGGIFYLYACLLVRKCMSVEAKESDDRKKDLSGKVLIATTVIFIALLPYKDMKEYLLPGNYGVMFEKGYAGMAQNAADELATSGIMELELKHDGTEKLMVVADAWDETTQFFEYTSVPQPINRLVNVPAADPGMLSGFIMDFVDEYVYVCNNAESSYKGDWSETGEITSDGKPLKSGALYRVDRTNDDKSLVLIK